MTSKDDIHEQGVIYLAFGRPFLAMAINSATTVRKNSPKFGITIVTNIKVDISKFTFWRPSTDMLIFVDDNDRGNRNHKTSIYEHSPYNKTVYLDCDTVVIGDLHPLALYLDYYDIGARPGKSPGPQSDRNRVLLEGRAHFHELPHWNGGVIAFKKSAEAKQFFQIWNSSFRTLGHKRDQPALVEAMFKTTAKAFPMEPRWNNSDNLNGDGLWEKKEIRDRTVVWHYKWDIDPQMREDIMTAANLALEGDMSDVLHFIKARSPSVSVRHPRHVFKLILRTIRGRLNG